MTLKKLQAPNTKIQRSFKHEAPKNRTYRCYRVLPGFWMSKLLPANLELGSWIFPGAWRLELGAF
jgi:hypothetical protein